MKDLGDWQLFKRTGVLFLAMLVVASIGILLIAWIFGAVG